MSFDDLVKLMDALRGEKGCPWDKKQTLDSLKPFLIEEAYEVIGAIEQDDLQKLKEELGDLLFHIVFMSKVCSDMGRFDIEDVIKFECQKMTRRHPHVFGASRNENADDVLKQWYQMKRQERAQKGTRSVVDGIPHKLPALQRAQKVQRRASQVGFDWQKPEDVLQKISEEMKELRGAISRRHQDDVSEELGDLLFSVVNVCRFLNVDAESALRGTSAKFTKRFKAMEQRAAARGKELCSLSLQEMDAEWEAVKAEEKER